MLYAKQCVVNKEVCYNHNDNDSTEWIKQSKY